MKNVPLRPAAQYEPNRNDRHQTDELPEWMTKKQVAAWLQCSQRQVEILTAKGRLPKPTYLGESSPRWKQSELKAALEANWAAE